MFESETSTKESLLAVNEKDTFTYHGKKARKEKTLHSVTSTNQLVTINKKQSYYDVTLDFSNSSHYEVAKAYGEAIMKIYPEYAMIMEPYIYENVNSILQDLDGDYTVLRRRMKEILPQVREEYRMEMEGLSDSIATTDNGFVLDNQLSKDEVWLMNLIPDIIRPTNCSGIAVYGNKSDTGATITGRILEWGLGNESQVSSAQAVVHFKNGEKSFTSFTILGLLDALSVLNDEGVFVAILDSPIGKDFISKNKKAYTYETRYAAEEFHSAEGVATYLASIGHEFTFSNNIFVTDKSCAYVVENCTDPSKGVSRVRTSESELLEGLSWTEKNAICVVNGFALKENFDNMTDSAFNLVRWKEFETRLTAYDKINVADIKDILTKNDPEDDNVMKLYSDATLQMILVDSKTGSIEIAFAPSSGDFKQHPEFVKVR